MFVSTSQSSPSQKSRQVPYFDRFWLEWRLTGCDEHLIQYSIEKWLCSKPYLLWVSILSRKGCTASDYRHVLDWWSVKKEIDRARRVKRGFKKEKSEIYQVWMQASRFTYVIHWYHDSLFWADEKGEVKLVGAIYAHQSKYIWSVFETGQRDAKMCS